MPRRSKRGGSNFQYKKRSEEQLRKRQEQQSGDFKSIVKDNVKIWKPGKTNAIRILPPTWDDAEHYALDVHIHYQVGADEERVLALHEMLGEEDPIRELRMEYEADGEKDLAKALRPGRACAMYIVDLDDEDEGVQLFLAPATVDAGIAQVSQCPRSGEMYHIDDPENGYDVFFDKQGEKLNTKYVGFQIGRDSSEISEEHLEFAIDNPIPDVLAYLEYEEIEKMIEGWTPTPKSNSKGKGSDRKSGSHRNRGGHDEDRRSNRRSNSRSNDERDEGEYNYDDVLAADWEELEQIIELENLDIDPTEYSDDENEHCAKDILEALGIEKPKPARSSRSSRSSRDGGSSRSRRSSRDDGSSDEERVRGMRRNRR